MSAAAPLGPDGRCETCGRAPAPADIEIRPGPGADPTLRDDAVSVALRQPHRLLEPLVVRGAAQESGSSDVAEAVH